MMWSLESSCHAAMEIFTHLRGKRNIVNNASFENDVRSIITACFPQLKYNDGGEKVFT